MEMLENHRLALIVAFYLSKFNDDAINNLGYKNFTYAFCEIGKRLVVKSNTVKNMRDEFDPLHPNNRKGWYQRELRPSRKDVYEKYKNLTEAELREVVKGIIM
jgi:hypothetical protein